MIKNKEVIILGSGMSILDLSEEEINYINNCEVLIAINKFMAFYKKSKIQPTHVYFVDNYDKTSIYFLQYIFNICRHDKLREITFILNKNIQNKKRSLTYNPFFYYLEKVYRTLRRRDDCENVFLIPNNNNFEFISHQQWMSGDSWAHTLSEPLFHYRGSLSTVLNYVSIKYPNFTIRLVGVDFNSSEYFFQEELQSLKISWEDWTTPIVKKENMHFSAISYKGTTIFDKFDFILKNLSLTGNSIYSCNPDSLLVTNEILDYKPLDL